MSYTLESLLAEESSLTVGSFSNDAAWRLGSLLVERARSGKLPIAVGIMRAGQRLFWYGAEGSGPDNDGWLERKLRTALRFGHSSLYMGMKIASRDIGIEQYGICFGEYSLHGGAVPIVLRGTGLVGALAVSGLDQEEDHRMAAEALAAL
jgi:uncharacterized protein (UPF0303 family)